MKISLWLFFAALSFQALAMDQADAERAYQRGRAQEAIKRYSGAAVFYEAATIADPNHAMAWRQLGSCEYNLGHKPRALEAWQVYLSLNPRDALIRKLVQQLTPPTPTPVPLPTAQPTPNMNSEMAPAPWTGQHGNESMRGRASQLSVSQPEGGASSGVAWVELKDAAAKSAAENKPILYDFNAAWCGPCKMLARDLFDNPESAAWINKKFVPVSVVDRKREEGRNEFRVQSLQARYQIQGFPTLIVEGAGRKELMRMLGYAGKEETLRRLKEISPN